MISWAMPTTLWSLLYVGTTTVVYNKRYVHLCYRMLLIFTSFVILDYCTLLATNDIFVCLYKLHPQLIYHRHDVEMK